MAKDNLKYPNTADHIVQFIALQFIKHAKSKSTKYQGANDTLHEVIRKRHSTHR